MAFAPAQGANLWGPNLEGADLTEANLEGGWNDQKRIDSPYKPSPGGELGPAMLWRI